jgi:hypothetical protein
MPGEGKDKKGPVHVEGAMGEVEHSQDAKDQGQAGSDQVNGHGDYNTVEELHKKLWQKITHPDLISLV